MNQGHDVPEIPKGYRPLQIGERTQLGDIYYTSNNWQPTACLGADVFDKMLGYFARPMTVASLQPVMYG